MAEYKHIGKNVIRKEGVEKIDGKSKYIDDISFPEMIHGVTVRSSVPHGKIKKISFEGDLPWDEITVVTAKDIPGRNVVKLILEDQPFLAEDVVNHQGEAIVLLAHQDKYLVERARKNVKIEIDPLPAVFTIKDSLAKTNVVWGEDNVQKSLLIDKGDVDSVWDTAHKVIEGEYETGAQEQMYIEPNGMIAIADSDQVSVWGSLQCPYYVKGAIEQLFGFPPEKVRIVQAETGGAFGGKEDFPSLNAAHASLLALKSGKPVKLIYDRAEDLAYTTKRHPSYTKHRTAVDKDGNLLAIDIDFNLDGGAYATLSAVVLSRGSLHAAGPYNCPNVRINAKAVATNTPPTGAFRGFGAPQSVFALERQLDRVALEIGMTPEAFRRRNFIKEGQTLSTGQLVREAVDMDSLLDSTLKELDYHEKFDLYPKINQNSKIKKGVGFATFMHGSGFTGSGEQYLASIAGVEASKDGKVTVLSASTEMGQGKNTIFSQIAADALDIDFDMVDVQQPDTDKVPNSGPTVASRTSMMVGKLVENACVKLLEELKSIGLKEAHSVADFKKACAVYIEKNGELKTESQYQQADWIKWDDETYKGDAYPTFAWASYAAEVTYDPVTYQVTVDNFVAAQEIGRVLHPMLATGQIEGGVLQGVGFAIYENVVYDNGVMTNNQMTNYVIPTAADAPNIKVIFAENPFPCGAAGCKGIGELPLDGAAVAVINAISHATGLDIKSLPMIPEEMMKLVEK